MRIWSMLAVVTAVGALCLGGCGGGDSGTASGGKKKIIIGIVAKSQQNPVFKAAHVGAQDGAKELGPKYGVEVQLDIRTPAGKEDAAEQADAIDTLVRQGAKGIAVACSDAKTLTSAINRAVDAGVPVICFDSDAPDSKRMAYYGTDDAEMGRRIMEALAKEMGDKGTVAIIAGNPSAPNLQARVAAVLEELKKHPNMQALSSGAVHHLEDPVSAAEALQNTQNQNKNISGWAFIGGWPLFTADALPWKPGEVKVVSADALPPEIKYLQDGYVQVLMGQDSYSWGYRSVDLLLDKVVNGHDPKLTKIYDPVKIVTKDNADEWMKNWKKWAP